MALKRPPQHRADATIIFVPRSDDAWDTPRIEAETAAMKARGEDPKRHPVARYHGGWTRYDLDAQGTVDGRAVTVREYLIESRRPTMFYLRRLDMQAWYEVEPQWESARLRGERPMACYLRCCALGLMKVENGPTLEMPHARPNLADMEKLYDIHQDLPYDIGNAVYSASLPLSEEEGKPSG
jgi:hypothetical protein